MNYKIKFKSALKRSEMFNLELRKKLNRSAGDL